MNITITIDSDRLLALCNDIIGDNRYLTGDRLRFVRAAAIDALKAFGADVTLTDTEHPAYEFACLVDQCDHELDLQAGVAFEAANRGI